MTNTCIVLGLDQPEGPAFRSDGQLLFVEMGDDRVCVSSVVDGKRREVVRPGGRPTGLAVDGDDCLWVAGGSGNSLVKLSPDGRELLRIAGDDQGSFLFPNDLAFGPDGLLYMTDSGMLPHEFITGLSIRPDFFTADYAGSVFQIDPRQGRVLARIDQGLRFTNGIAFGPDGGLFVAETLSGWIFRYALDGRAQREPFSQTLTSVNNVRFRGPDGMAFDADGLLYCALYGCGEISVSATDGSIVQRLPSNGALPTNLAFVPGESAIVVTEVENGALERIPVGAEGLALHQPTWV
ncbi:SMP-30/gluconolactonase/LRE family protein [Neorhizobium galegae]|uniref:SMP-30/gluconolactonase/LRE family protein n=1 Tax=Neorhizobium galegae TaxID=399 RepID=A0A6A1TWQ9_NEOGA|nr:SMP-30/gluconolactonase/LRE family protein [Neorhizobium galegae]KAB1089331.1 SMP-30/gluconolactonase/LRE family protein [Neorhizobium galegae]